MSFERISMVLMTAAIWAALSAVESVASDEEGSAACDAFATPGGECLRQAATEGRAMLQMKGHGPAALEATADHATAKNTASAMAPLSLVDGSVLAKFNELKRRVQQLRKEGQSPQGVAQWIAQQLLPLANQTKATLQAEVNNAQQAAIDCDTALANQESGAREQETTLSIGEARHNECELVHQQKAKNAQDDCQAVQQICDTIVAPPSVAEVDLNDTQAVMDALQANYQFLQQEYATFNQEAQTCTSATQLADEQLQQCQTDMANLEASYCSLKTARADICTDYSACHQEKKARLLRVIADVKEVENYTKTTYQALTCHSQTFLQDSVTCDPATVDVTALDVFYPGEPTLEACSDEVSTSWNYSADVCDGGVTQAPAAGGGAATTQAPAQAGGNVTSGNASSL